MTRLVPLLAALALIGSSACSRPPLSQGSAALSARAEAGRVVAGAPGDPAVAALLDVLAPGVTLEEQQWSVGGYRSPRRGVLLVAVLEDPQQPGVPVTLAVSDEPALLAEATPRLGGGWRPCVELWRVGHRELVARLTVKGKLRPHTVQVDEFEDGMVAGALQHGSGLEVRYFKDERIATGRLHDYIDGLVEAVQRASWAEIELPRSLQVVARVEGDRLGFVDPSSGALAVTLAGVLDDGGAAYVEHLLRDSLDAPGSERVPRVASIAAAGRVMGKPLIWVIGGDPRSEVARVARDAAAWDQLDDDGRAAAWTSGELPAPASPGGVPFLEWSQSLGLGDLSGVGGDRSTLIRVLVSLDRAPQDGRPWRREGFTLDGDERVLAQLARAGAGTRRVGVEVVCVSSPSTSFDGDRVLTTAEQWRAHFEAREHATRHVAFLAQMAGADVLLVGAGPMRSASTVWTGAGEEPAGLQEAREARLAGWTRLVTSVREVYGGRVGHVANLSPSAAHIGFWDQLDLVGVRLQPPPLANRKGMRNRFTGNLTWGAEFAASHGKPPFYLAPGLDRGQRDALIDAWELADERLRGVGILIGDLDEDQAERLR